MATDTYGKSIGNGNFQPGLRLLDGSWLTAAFAKMFQGGISRQDGIVAKAGGTKAAATALTKSLNRIATCATLNDSVLLPKAIAGSVCMVVNSGAATCAVFGKGTDTIDGVSTATAKALAAGKGLQLMCVTTGAWVTVSLVA